jgi:hypothetical protein
VVDFYYRVFKKTNTSAYRRLKTLKDRCHLAQALDPGDGAVEDLCASCAAEGAQLYGCDRCDLWFCMPCSGATAAAMDSDSPWSCSRCTVAVQPVPSESPRAPAASTAAATTASAKKKKSPRVDKWAQCEDCSKWRRLPDACNPKALLSDLFFCRLNAGGVSACAAPQEVEELSTEDDGSEDGSTSVGSKPKARRRAGGRQEERKTPAKEQSARQMALPKLPPQAAALPEQALDWLLLWNDEWFPACFLNEVPSGFKFAHADKTVTIVSFLREYNCPHLLKLPPVTSFSL